MPKIKLYNNIAQIGLDQFTENYEVNENMNDEDAILVRSANLHDIRNMVPILKLLLGQVPVSTILILIHVQKKELPYLIHLVQIVTL